jgi:hypothetical protein
LLGQIAEEQEQPEVALGHYRNGVCAEREDFELPDALDCLEGAALWLSRHDEPVRAATLLGAAQGQRDAHGIAHEYQPAREALPDLRANLRPAAFRNAFAAGHAMTWEQAVDCLDQPLSPIAPPRPSPRRPKS